MSLKKYTAHIDFLFCGRVLGSFVYALAELQLCTMKKVYLDILHSVTVTLGEILPKCTIAGVNKLNAQRAALEKILKPRAAVIGREK